MRTVENIQSTPSFSTAKVHRSAVGCQLVTNYSPKGRVLGKNAGGGNPIPMGASKCSPALEHRSIPVHAAAPLSESRWRQIVADIARLPFSSCGRGAKRVVHSVRAT
jgi:hypothetical protein